MIILKLVISFIKLINPLLRKAGINPKHLQAILTVKLTMDNRKELSLNSNNKKRNSLVTQTIFNLIFGIFLGFIILQGKIDTGVRFFFLHSSIMILFTIMIISEFSTIIFDTRDNTEILPRPIDPKTYYASKIFHIIIYLLIIGIPLSLGSIVTTTIKFGIIGSLALIILIFFDVLISVFLSNLFYMGIIKFFSAKKIKDIILYLQVFLAIGFYGGYQFLPRLFESRAMANSTLPDGWWANMIPTIWAAKISDFLASGNFLAMWPYIILNVAVPLLGLLAIVKYFAPFYNQKLSQLDAVTPGKKKTKTKQARRFYLVNFLPVSSKEKATYRLITKNLLGDRKFKQGIYSILGYFIVIMLLPVISYLDTPSEILPNLVASEKYFFFLYFPAMMSLITIAQIQYSDHSSASWLFRFLPYDQPGQILFSGFLFIIIRFMLPIAVITNTIVLFIWGSDALTQMVLSWPLSLFAMITIVLISEKKLPLSRARTMQDSAKSFLSFIYVLILAIGLWGISKGCSYLPTWGILAVGLIIFIVFLFLSQKVRNIMWDKVIY